MPVPQVAIIGRPNVGKSSLLNWLARKRLAIVDDKPGVTRDRIQFLMNERDRFFELVDTGGIGVVDIDDLTDEVERQITAAIEQADVILFVVDTRAGVLPLDSRVAARLRVADKPILLVANKTDDPALDTLADEFHSLASGPLLRVSALQNRNRELLLEAIVSRLPPLTEDNAVVAEPVMKLAIVGRRNVGKSTFVNTLARAERMIVSEIAGTTRDSVDVRFELDGKTFIAIDTPGLRRNKSVRTDLDFYSTHRAQRSIRRADVVLLFFDPTERISRVDKQLCQYIGEHFRPCVFVVNKWDLMAASMPTERWVQYLRDTFQTMWYAPIAFITGQSGKNVKALLNHAQNLFKQSLHRVTTGELNRLIRAAVRQHPPHPVKGRTGKIYYATQVAIQPPTLVLVCNDPKAFSQQYRRYLLGVIRDHLDFGEVPIKLYLHRRSESDRRDDVSKRGDSRSKKRSAGAESAIVEGPDRGDFDPNDPRWKDSLLANSGELTDDLDDGELDDYESGDDELGDDELEGGELEGGELEGGGLEQEIDGELESGFDDEFDGQFHFDGDDGDAGEETEEPKPAVDDPGSPSSKKNRSGKGRGRPKS
jgi:GTP-binding protein